MLENEEIVVNTNADTQQQDSQPVDNQTESNQDDGKNSDVQVDNKIVDENKAVTEKRFTQAELDNIVKERLSRVKKDYYGYENEEKLKEALEKSKKYDSVSHELSFIKHNVNPAKYDDVITYFKGKNAELTDNELEEALKTRPEWLNGSTSTTIEKLSAPTNTPKKDSIKELAEKYYGRKFD